MRSSGARGTASGRSFKPACAQAAALLHAVLRCTLVAPAQGGEPERRAATLAQHLARVDGLAAAALPPAHCR